MRILAIGDVTSPHSAEFLSSRLWSYREEKRIDLCVVNGENAAFINGVTPPLAKALLSGGADVITGGNHSLNLHTDARFFDDTPTVLRPLNFPAAAPGAGYTIAEAKNGYRVLVMSAMGTVGIDPVLDAPYRYIDSVLSREAGRYDFSVLDFHAEATGEKIATASYYDGRINIIFGTHTHVPTADLTILPGGTGYVTDVGMCGASGGILGMRRDTVIRRIVTKVPEPFMPAEGACYADGVIFTLSEANGRVTDLQRVLIK